MTTRRAYFIPNFLVHTPPMNSKFTLTSCCISAFRTLYILDFFVNCFNVNLQALPCILRTSTGFSHEITYIIMNKFSMMFQQRLT